MLIQFYNPIDQQYLIADTVNMTNSRWYSSFDEANFHISDVPLFISDSDYTLTDIQSRFPKYVINEINAPTQSYEYW